MKVHSIVAGLFALLYPLFSYGGQISYGPTWNDTETPTGNYFLTVKDDAETGVGTDQWDWVLTVNDPWNAEAFRLYVDLGNNTVGTFSTADLTGVSSAPATGEAVVVEQIDDANDPGQQGMGDTLPVSPATPDGEWEIVFLLGDNGWDGVRTWTFTTPDFGLSLDTFGTVVVRGRTVCGPNETLPDDESSCGDSDKAYLMTPNDPGGPPTGVPLPSTLILLLAPLLALGVRQLHRT